MVAFKDSIVLVLALLPSLADALCANNDGYLYDDDGRDRNCKNIRLREERRVVLCQIPEVNLNCPQTCGKCCEDDPDYLIIRKNGLESGCDWLYGGKPGVRTNRYCDKWNNGRPVKDACPVACDFCFTDAEITVKPSAAPTLNAPKTPAPTKSVAPSKAPSPPTGKPSVTPTQQPTRPPSPMPSPFPTLRPTSVPSDSPSERPSNEPSVAPSEVPSDDPSSAPSVLPSDSPSEKPSNEPSVAPSEFPSDQPSVAPSEFPSDKPSRAPSDEPSLEPSGFPSDRPTNNPSSEPSVSPTGNPTRSIKPSPSPSAVPTNGKTEAPSKAPTKTPTKSPTKTPVACTDATEATFTWELDFAGTTVSCDWLTKNKNDDKNLGRMDTYCPRSEIKEACCETCAGY